MIAKNAQNELNDCIRIFCNQTLMGRIISRYPELARTINNYKHLYELETKEHTEKIRGERPRLEEFRIKGNSIDFPTVDLNKYLTAVRAWENGL